MTIKNPNEKYKQVRAIELLALESHMSIIDVEQLYEEELAVLKTGPHITNFLSIITSRKVRERLRRRARALGDR